MGSEGSIAGSRTVLSDGADKRGKGGGWGWGGEVMGLKSAFVTC